ncbi:MAG: M23 family metallopeptidase [Cytophagaceae bacterium]|nr:M23 family metallopeptidase [Cytophagaceae bacterium]
MARIKYYYDTETCKYERLRVSTWDLILNTLGFLFVSLIFGAGLLWVYLLYFKSPYESSLEKQNDELILYYEILNKEVDEANQMLASLQERDDNIYRVIFEAEPIPRDNTGGLNKYREVLQKDQNYQKTITETIAKIEKLKKQMYIQTKSYDEIIKLAKNKTQMLACIPAIQPVRNKELTKLASGFGMRIHPIYKVKKMHTGVDFSAPRGTPIYATGDGVVKVVATNLGGYGKEIEIDHGYGYVTKYAHLDRFNVALGQKIKRGELVGYIGTTGASTAPHLHYEVIHNNEKVNPVHYFYHDLSPAEYEKILELASVENQSLS